MQATEAMEDLRAFLGYTRREGLPPTVRAFQAEAGLSSSSNAQYRLLRLASLGYIERRTDDAENRVWRLTKKGEQA